MPRKKVETPIMTTIVAHFKQCSASEQRMILEVLNGLLHEPPVKPEPKKRTPKAQPPTLPGLGDAKTGGMVQ